MADEKETPTAEPESPDAPEQEQAPETAPADPQEERIDRIVAQRLGKYAARTREAEAQVREYADRVARLEGRVDAQAPKPAAPAQPQMWTPEQLQAAVDQGRITPAQMADQIAWQRIQQGKTEIRQEIRQENRNQAALSEVNQYIAKMPALTSTSSPEFRKVAAAAQEIADEMNLPIQDARVQRRALRETFGTLDRIADVRSAREFDREHADTHAASGSGGGRTEPRTKDKLAGIPPAQIAFWKAKNYSQKMMEDEAVFYRQRTRSG